MGGPDLYFRSYDLLIEIEDVCQTACVIKDSSSTVSTPPMANDSSSGLLSIG